MNIKKISFSEIPTKAVKYWRRTIFYQIVFSLLYSAIYIGLNYFLCKHYGIFDQLLDIFLHMTNDIHVFSEKYVEIVSSEAFEKITICMIVVSAILFPLNIGLLNIYRKLDNLEKISLGDLFTGYKGNDFFKYLCYYLFWGGVYHLCKVNLILMIIWIIITLLVGPLMFLKNVSVVKAFQLNFKVFRINIWNFLLVFLLSTFGSYIGYAFVGIGLLVTFPFWNAVLYVFYKEIFTDNLPDNVKS